MKLLLEVEAPSRKGMENELKRDIARIKEKLKNKEHIYFLFPSYDWLGDWEFEIKQVWVVEK